MPEGPEIHIAARFINQVSAKHKFGGPIVKSEVSTKNPDVNFLAKHYKIHAEARGKELKVFLEDVEQPKNKTHILFRFGMSGCYKLTDLEDLPKHAHLRFFTIDEKPIQVLSFVDYRRFGRWEIQGNWGKDRGPDPMFDYKNFRANILSNLKAATFNKAICETMLDQKYFNGIGNYLRAEILYRAKIKPFVRAREVLENLDEEGDLKKPDVLDLCTIVPSEVLTLNKGRNYDPDFEQSDQTFGEWLQCYYVEGMNNLQDGNGRTMWFEGEPGPLVPKNARVVGRKGGTGSKVPQSGNVKVEVKEEIEEKPIKGKGKPKSKKKDIVKKEVKEDIKTEPIIKEEVDIKEEKEVKSDYRKNKRLVSKKSEVESPAPTRKSKRTKK